MSLKGSGNIIIFSEWPINQWLEITDQMLKKETSIFYLLIYIKRIREVILFSQVSYYKIIIFYKLKDSSSFASYS